jgi:hypothetical protein
VTPLFKTGGIVTAAVRWSEYAEKARSIELSRD